ncbi:MAG: thioredoxin domain-containing protein [Saprospiraceae bacterium]
MQGRYITLYLTIITLLFNSCHQGQTPSDGTKLSATVFAEKISELPSAPIVDVRTPEEFEKGHLVNAKNFDWNSSNFDVQISGLDKSLPVFVYCLSGGRSSSAVNKMLSAGFKEVYEMDGGILKWRAANFPESATPGRSEGMNKQQFDALLNTDKLTLIDFYADWCAPCKKMKPYLDEIAKDMADKVVVIRINADDNQTLCKELNVDALPCLQLYIDKILTWSNNGFIEKPAVVAQLQ